MSKKVYCKDCKWAPSWAQKCRSPKVGKIVNSKEHLVYGITKEIQIFDGIQGHISFPDFINSHFDCKYYELKLSKKWWKFWI